MIVSYDNIADAMYIQIDPAARVAKTVEFAPETFVDLDAKGGLIGIEMLHPASLILKHIAKKFHHPELSRIKTRLLQKAVA